jgi:hypothetical protein
VWIWIIIFLNRGIEAFAFETTFLVDVLESKLIPTFAVFFGIRQAIEEEREEADEEQRSIGAGSELVKIMADGYPM